MRWFKCPNLSSPEIIQAEAAIGGQGVFSCLKVLEQAHDQEIYELDAVLIAKWASLKMDRAQKILPFAQKILQESLKILGKSSEILSKSSDFTPASPSPEGSLIERIERENREKEKEKKEKEKSDAADATGLNFLEKDWDEFYALYPRKIKPGEGKKMYMKARKTKTRESLLAALERYKKSKPAYQDWMYPATFLNPDNKAYESEWGNSPLKEKPAFVPAKAYQSLFPPYNVYTLDEWDVGETYHFNNAGIRNKASPNWTIPLSELKPLEVISHGTFQTTLC